jgi:hypothetical protein
VESQVKPSLLDELEVDVLQEGLVGATTIGLSMISQDVPMLHVLAFSTLGGMLSYFSLKEEWAFSSLE